MAKSKKARLGAFGRIAGRAGMGGVTLSLVRQATPDMFGKYQSAVDKLATGALFKLIKRGPAHSFIEVAVAEIVSNLFDDFVVPKLGGLLGGGGGGTLMKANGGIVNTKAAMAR